MATKDIVEQIERMHLNLTMNQEQQQSMSGVALMKNNNEIIGEDNMNQDDEGIGQEQDSGGAEEANNSVPEEIESSDSIRFYPPVYLQRYAAVKDILKAALGEPGQSDPVNGRTVMEVGCAEFGMMKYFKAILGIGKLLFLDIDEQLLLEKRYHLRPFPAEHLMKLSRPKPLVVEAYAGDISKVDTKILEETPSVWAVVAIELIEHLYPETLRGFEISVFGVISPSIVIVTTPNSDFNSKFNLGPGQFRHWDHKFEWSREEFKQWCNKICSEFQDYTYVYGGVCAASPEELEQFGHVSQMAVFRKTNRNEMQINTQFPAAVYSDAVMPNAYKLIERVVYPNFIETRTAEKVVLDELEYTLKTYWFSQKNIEHYNETGVTEILFPLANLQRANDCISNTIAQNAENLKKILEAAQYEVLMCTDGQYAIKLKVPSIYDIPDKELDDETWITDEMEGVADSGTSVNSSSHGSEIEESWE